MTTREQTTFCRICEPYCGLIATVEDDRLIGLRPDPDHVASRGFACAKGLAYPGVQNDPDRVLHPLKRQPDGSFARVSWDEAIGGHRLAPEANHRRPRRRVGCLVQRQPLRRQLQPLDVGAGSHRRPGSKHSYGAGSQDTNSRWAASALLYGTCPAVPVPDLDRTEMALIIGANPVVSHGSLATIPTFFAEKLHAVVGKGGRVVVVDPRRTENRTGVRVASDRPDADAYLLLSLIHVLFAENLVDRERADAQASGVDGLEQLAAALSRPPPPRRRPASPPSRSTDSPATWPRSDRWPTGTSERAWERPRHW